MKWEKGRVPVSLCTLGPERARVIESFRLACKDPPFRSLGFGINFIWAMNKAGEINIAVEEVAEMMGETVNGGYPFRRNFPDELVEKVREKKLGHPCLTEDQTARIAGELYLDEVNGEYGWYLNFKSGRFHCEPERRPSEGQQTNAAQIFADLLGTTIFLDLPGDFV